jgi:hypothetical protein
VLALLPAQGGWRNGRRARFRSVCPKGREGSNPSSPTRRFMLFAGPLGQLPVGSRSAGPGGRPPGTPRAAHSWLPVLAVGLVPACSGFSPWVGAASFWFSPLALFWFLAVGLVLVSCGARRGVGAGLFWFLAVGLVPLCSGSRRLGRYSTGSVLPSALSLNSRFLESGRPALSAGAWGTA